VNCLPLRISLSFLVELVGACNLIYIAASYCIFSFYYYFCLSSAISHLLQFWVPNYFYGYLYCRMYDTQKDTLTFTAVDQFLPDQVYYHGCLKSFLQITKWKGSEVGYFELKQESVSVFSIVFSPSGTAFTLFSLP
jgi:hypothetical protein